MEMHPRSISPTKPRAPTSPPAHPAPTAASSKPRAASGFSFSRALKGAAAASAPANTNAPTTQNSGAPEPATPSPTPLPAQTAASTKKAQASSAATARQTVPAPEGSARGGTARVAPSTQPATPWGQLGTHARHTLLYCLSWAHSQGHYGEALARAYVEGTKPATAEEHARCVAYWLGFHGWGDSRLGAAVADAVQFLQDSPASRDDDGRPVPRLPKTAKQAAQVQRQIDQWLQQGELWQAFPSQCVLAVYGLWTRPDHADTVQAVMAVAESMHQREEEECMASVHPWLLYHAYHTWGLYDPRIRRLAVQMADMHCRLGDPRQHSSMLRALTALAQQLPGGLGWGSTVVAPVPDEEGYNRHAFMQAQGTQACDQGKYELAHTMLQRCLTYYKTMGLHWLGTSRRILTGVVMSRCVSHLQGHAEYEKMAHQYKREAVKVLGPNHPTTLCATWEHGLALVDLKRYEQGMSILQQCMRMRQSVLGRYHASVFDSQVRVGTMHACIRVFDSQVRVSVIARVIASMRTRSFAHTVVCKHSFWHSRCVWRAGCVWASASEDGGRVITLCACVLSLCVSLAILCPCDPVPMQCCAHAVLCPCNPVPMRSCVSHSPVQPCAHATLCPCGFLCNACSSVQAVGTHMLTSYKERCPCANGLLAVSLFAPAYR